MSKKKRKRRNPDHVFGHIFMLFIALIALYELIFAGECYFAASNMDAYMEDAYSGSCELSEYIEHHRRRQYDVPYHIFDLDNGKAIGFPQERLNEAGFDPERFVRLEGEPMRFVHTKLPRLFHSWRIPLAIEYNGENLLPREGMEKLLREEARWSLEIAGVIMIIPMLYLSGFLLYWAFGLWSKRINRNNHKRNRRRKLEKKEHYYAKQELLNEKINSSKGD